MLTLEAFHKRREEEPLRTQQPRTTQHATLKECTRQSKQQTKEKARTHDKPHHRLRQAQTKHTSRAHTPQLLYNNIRYPVHHMSSLAFAWYVVSMIPIRSETINFVTSSSSSSPRGRFLRVYPQRNSEQAVPGGSHQEVTGVCCLLVSVLYWPTYDSLFS